MNERREIAVLEADLRMTSNVVAVQLQTIRELEAELKKRDKCSYMGPMRDCPTHGEDKDAARYRWLKRQPWVKTKGIHAWGALLDDAIDEARHDAPDETPNDQAQGEAQGSSRLSPGATGSAARDSEKENDSEHC